MLEIFLENFKYVFFLFGFFIFIRFYLLGRAYWASESIRDERVYWFFRGGLDKISKDKRSSFNVEEQKRLYNLFCKYFERSEGMNGLFRIIAFIASLPFLMHLLEFFTGELISGGISKSAPLLTAFAFVSLLFAIFYNIYYSLMYNPYEREKKELEEIIARNEKKQK